MDEPLCVELVLPDQLVAGRNVHSVLLAFLLHIHGLSCRTETEGQNSLTGISREVLCERNLNGGVAGQSAARGNRAPVRRSRGHAPFAVCRHVDSQFSGLVGSGQFFLVGGEFRNHFGIIG